MGFRKTSELWAFVYCERRWWLEKKGYRDLLLAPQKMEVETRMQAGVDYHNRYSASARWVAKRRRGIGCLTWIAILAVVWFLLFLLARVYGLPPDRPRLSAATKHQKVKDSAPKAVETRMQDMMQSQVILTAAVVGSFVFCVFLLAWRLRVRRRKWNVPAGALIAVDDSDVTFKCESLGLVGRPDAVWKYKGRFVPEERKSGAMRGRNGPHWNDVVQLAAYCYLVKRNIGPVERGLITYGNNQQFSVSYSRSLENRMISIVKRMHKLAARDAVHRSHRSQKKCRFCPVASVCGEQL